MHAFFVLDMVAYVYVQSKDAVFSVDETPIIWQAAPDWLTLERWPTLVMWYMWPGGPEPGPGIPTPPLTSPRPILCCEFINIIGTFEVPRWRK